MTNMNRFRGYASLAVVLICLLFPCNGVSLAQPPASPLLLGTAWYPEQWPESRWEADLALMQQAGIRMVRVGEFAWSRMEPEEGQLRPGLAGSRDRRGRETWNLYRDRHTDGRSSCVAYAKISGDVAHRMKRAAALNMAIASNLTGRIAKYRELARKIAEQMAKRFGHNPSVLGWQIDNEYSDVSFDPETRTQFQQWLKARYGTLDNLNARWTTAYWSETYTDWNQIPIQVGYGNPGFLLSWMRFVSDTWRSYQKNQLDVIRANSDPRQFITTNMMGAFDGFDHYTVEQDLDMAAWDDYVGEGHLDAVRNGAAHDLTRGFKQKNFWVMETQPGNVNWAPINNSLDKGEVRAMAWHDVGHGADAVSYWQWRSALNGQEEYHGTLLGSDGTPVPLYAEVAQVGKEFAKAGPVLAGTSVKSEVAVLHSYDSRWAIQWQKHNDKYDPVEEILSYYGPLRVIAQSVDIVFPDCVAQPIQIGGCAGPECSYRRSCEKSNRLCSRWRALGFGPALGHEGRRQFAAARTPARATGCSAWRARGTILRAATARPGARKLGQGRITALGGVSGAKDSGTEVLMRYGKSNGWLDGQPAAISRKVGNGRITYIGAWLDPKTMAEAAKWMTDTSGVKPVFGPVPAGVEVSARYGAHGAVFIVINLSGKPQAITLPREMNDVLEGGSKRSVNLPYYGVAVLSAAR